MRKRIDRFVEDALIEFGDWYVDADWYGKERDCVNMFAHGFLASRVQPDSAIEELTQIRIEAAVPQPSGYRAPAAAKDLVIWNDGLSTAWDPEWQATNWPKVVMEWKFKKVGNPPKAFNEHDMSWLNKFTAEFDDTFGYVIRIYDGPRGRVVDWAKVTRGAINETNRRS